MSILKKFLALVFFVLFIGTVSPTVKQIVEAINNPEDKSLVMASIVGSLIIPVLFLAIACRLAFSKSKTESESSESGDLIDSGFDDE